MNKQSSTLSKEDIAELDKVLNGVNPVISIQTDDKYNRIIFYSFDTENNKVNQIYWRFDDVQTKTQN